MTPLLLIAAFAALTWGLVLMRRGGPLVMAMMTLLLGICFGPEFFNQGPITMDRLALVATVAGYILYMKLGRNEPKPLSKPDLLLIALMGLLIVSTFTHDWRFQENAPLMRLIFYYLAPFSLYWVARQSQLSERFLRNVFIAVGIFGLYLAMTAVFEIKEVGSLVFPRYIASQAQLEFLGRGRGPLLNPSGNGILICLSLSCTLMQWPRLSQPGRLMILLAYVLFAAGVYATLTRCAWIGAVLGTAIIAWETFPLKIRKVLIVLSLFGAGVVLPLSWNSIMAFKRDKNVSVQDMKDSARLRPLLAYAAWNVFRDKPLTGLGLGHYIHHNSPYVSDRSSRLNLEKVRPYHQHNIFLSLLTEVGLPGMVFLASLITYWSLYAFRLWRANIPLVYRQLGLVHLTLIAAYLANGMFQDVTIVPMVHMVLFFFSGLVVGQYQRRVAAPLSRVPWQRRTSWGPAHQPSVA